MSSSYQQNIEKMITTLAWKSAHNKTYITCTYIYIYIYIYTYIQTHLEKSNAVWSHLEEPGDTQEEHCCPHNNIHMHVCVWVGLELEAWSSGCGSKFCADRQHKCLQSFGMCFGSLTCPAPTPGKGNVAYPTICLWYRC